MTYNFKKERSDLFKKVEDAGYDPRLLGQFVDDPTYPYTYCGTKKINWSLPIPPKKVDGKSDAKQDAKQVAKPLQKEAEVIENEDPQENVEEDIVVDWKMLPEEVSSIKNKY